ncbi:MAG: 50S ribosomal protein L13 [Candidatus Magasanikbacteria bacterium CG_4_10_14_0_8_um_filter_32_14]|uniref:Large ribosomal subunit protein uL13 n=2 Tax=Candidatus Magasanikiibacteriota TaxID=1752731 RepID=A0A2M7R9D5_9BACT|nr:MAG: 50S ribosomal protein L13 [Candidatus Magasanikbacteria bacterium CG1_02_32_51]PIY93177.1 MAG: 50S ribosomal protein L13 [Candidatus Magasanikbacteria bacterium CG_4_10_14_0_8_um_filter_32_14]
MPEEIKREIIQVDATDKAVGRVASEVAKMLMGKNKPTFVRHIDKGDFVIINNAKLVKFTGKKLVQKDYYRHSGHPGGLKITSMKKIFDNDPTEVMRRAIYNMLPKNKLRDGMLKRLTIKA